MRAAWQTYRYDAVGNRLSQQVTQGGSTLTSRYQYDSNDRLLSEDSDGLITTYSWDANGNLLKKQSPDGNSTSYAGTAGNGLILVDTGSQKTEYERDAQGQRIKTPRHHGRQDGRDAAPHRRCAALRRSYTRQDRQR
ncbi:MAG: RHS repeat protein [Uliginosibacterium sp.]|nr:RHS repeat protein [Uliginosibacterium sp.]